MKKCVYWNDDNDGADRRTDPELKLRTLFKRILVGEYPTWTDLNSIYWGGLWAKKLVLIREFFVLPPQSAQF